MERGVGEGLKGVRGSSGARGSEAPLPRRRAELHLPKSRRNGGVGNGRWAVQRGGSGCRRRWRLPQLYGRAAVRVCRWGTHFRLAGCDM